MSSRGISPFFADLRQQSVRSSSEASGHRASLQAFGTRLRFARDKTIFSEGDRANHIFEVVAGSVRLCKYLADGRRQIIDFALKGDFIALAQSVKYTLTAEASSDAVITAYPKRQLRRFSEESPSLCRWLMAILDRQILAMQDHLVMLGRQTGMERVAGFIFILFERCDASEGDAIDVPMTRQDIADYLGLRIESVSRFVSGMKRCHVIHMLEPHSVIVKDLELLRLFAGSSGTTFAPRGASNRMVYHA